MTPQQTETTVDVTAVAAAEDQLKSEHARMGDLLQRVGAADDLEALAPLLRQLHTQLRHHFAREEYPGGLYDSMGACVPEFRESIRILADDHFRLLAHIRTVMSKAEQGGESMRDAVLADVNDLIGFIRNHEAREHEMAGAARRRAAGR